MAAPALTYTLVNGATADASQVMQNFNDLLNGITDGTKDLSISALTCAGSATFNGTLNTIGNSTSDDLVVTARLASHLIPKTDTTYDLGASTLGYASIYLGDGDAETARVIAAAHATSRTYSIPDCSGNADFVMTAGNQATIAGVKTFTGQLIGAGTATNDAAASGYIGEIITTGAASGNMPGATGVYNHLTSINLTAGDWDVSAHASVAGSNITSSVDMYISTDSGSTATDRVLGVNHISAVRPGSDATNLCIARYRLSLSGADTIYLKFRATYTGTPTIDGIMSARRVR